MRAVSLENEEERRNCAGADRRACRPVQRVLMPYSTVSPFVYLLFDENQLALSFRLLLLPLCLRPSTDTTSENGGQSSKKERVDGVVH